MRSSDGLDALARAWGREGRAFDRWPVEVAELPQSRAELAALFESAPAETLEVMSVARAPGDRMPRQACPARLAAILDAIHETPLVVRLGNLAPFSAAAKDWTAAYRRLLSELFGPRTAARSDVRVDLYLASPGAVSRFHADPSHNFVIRCRTPCRAFATSRYRTALR